MGVFEFRGDPDEPDDERNRKLASVYENSGSLAMTVPAAMADDVGVEAGTKVIVEERPEGLYIEPVIL